MMIFLFWGPVFEFELASGPRITRSNSRIASEKSAERKVGRIDWYATAGIYASGHTREGPKPVASIGWNPASNSEGGGQGTFELSSPNLSHWCTDYTLLPHGK